MPDCAFFLKNGQLEDHVLDLPDDTAAVEEGLYTAAGMLHDLEVPEVGKFSQFLEIKERGETLLQIEIHAKRRR